MATKQEAFAALKRAFPDLTGSDFDKYLGLFKSTKPIFEQRTKAFQELRKLLPELGKAQFDQWLDKFFPDHDFIRISRTRLIELYGSARYMGSWNRKKLGLTFEIPVYIQDPQLGKKNKAFGIKSKTINWEPVLDDGPTSSRLAVVDYNGNNGTLLKPAIWDEANKRFLAPDGSLLNKKMTDHPNFHQVNVWAIAHRALENFESSQGLGMRIGWAFPGNHLIIVPHAGYGKNAFYDRSSKSLQFYYYEDENGEPVFTCLMADVIHHELAHAVLDSLRPWFLEAVTSIENAAFHEFFGDISAVLLFMRHNEVRKEIAKQTTGDMKKADVITSIAEQFGSTVTDNPYLRTARSDLDMESIVDTMSAHEISQVLTSAMFDILLEISYRHKERGKSILQDWFYSIQRMLRMTLQAIHFLPPVDVTFKDYVLAFLRSLELSIPRDPRGYRDACIKVFEKRKLLSASEADRLKDTAYLYQDRPNTKFSPDVGHPIRAISGSRAGAYQFLDENRRKLLIPRQQDILVGEIHSPWLSGRRPHRIGQRHIIQYRWDEVHLLRGRRFGRFRGENILLACGGTLVFDHNGNLIYWTRKPGTAVDESWKNEDARRERREGRRRLRRLEDFIVGAVRGGVAGLREEFEDYFVAGLVPPVGISRRDGALSFALAPHLSLKDQADDDTGERRWSISS